MSAARGCQLRVGDYFIIDREAREIMHSVASVRPSVCPFVRLFALSQLNRLTLKGHYQSKVFVCVCL